MFKPKNLEDYSQEEKNQIFENLYDSCLKYFNYIKGNEFHEDNDYDHYLYEDLLSEIFSQEFWDFLNNKIK